MGLFWGTSGTGFSFPLQPCPSCGNTIAGVLMLINGGVVGAAYAMVRDIIRGTRLGLWINACAISDQILNIPQEDEFVVSIPEMNRDIEAAYQGDSFFVKLRDRWAAKLYRYSRETIIRVGHFHLDPKSGLEHVGRGSARCGDNCDSLYRYACE